jgi:hypothetical protein
VIVNFFLTLLTSILGPLVDALPTASIPNLDNQDSGPLMEAGAVLLTIDQYVPILAPLHFLFYLLSLAAPLLAFRLGVFVWKLIRG